MKKKPGSDEAPLTPEERYAEIMRRIQAGGPPKQARHYLDTLLDDLNVVATFEQTLPSSKGLSVILYGPQSFKGPGWRSVLVWYREKGYRKFQNLWLYGLWAQQQPEGEALMSMGQRLLHYRAPVYTAEAYHKLIKRGFSSYYEDQGGPPTEEDSIHWQFIYDPYVRRSLRQQVLDRIRSWGDGLRG